MVKVIIPRVKIEKKVKQLAKEVYKDYKKYNELNLVTVLIGAKYFSNDFKREIKKLGMKNVKENFIKLRSYVGTKSTGKIKVVKDIKSDISNKDVLIIEDIADTRHTLHFLKDHLLNKKYVKSVRICCFLDKPSRKIKEVKLDYVGYKVPNRFIVGYGLDYKGKYRRLKYVGII